MAFSFGTQLFGALLFLTLATSVIGHSYITSPRSRGNQVQTQSGCRGPSCFGPCEVPLSAKKGNTRVQSAMRGDTITIKWPRNNHAGGFIRFAWAPTSQSDSHAAFDAHVQQINCHEVGGCRPDDASNPNGGDTAGSDGSVRPCTTVLSVPLDLADGEWTLQWSWFGGAFSLGDYYSCVDYKIAGGANGTLVPKFVGGDYSFPGQQKCKFFNTDKLHMCVNEPCSNPIYPPSQQQSGPVAQGQLGAALPPTVPSTPVTTAAVPVVPATTAAPNPVVPATTASVPVVVPPKPATTAAVPVPKPATTASKPMSTMTPPVPTGNTGCVLGNQICIGGSQYQTCANDRVGTYWAAPQSCQTGLSCHASSTSNNIYCY